MGRSTLITAYDGAISCADPGFFVFFFVLFSSPQLILQKSNGQFQ